MEWNSKNGKRLKEERDRMGLSQQEVADKFKKTSRTIQYYEKGEKGGFTMLECIELHEMGFDVCYIATGKKNGTKTFKKENKNLEYNNENHPA